MNQTEFIQRAIAVATRDLDSPVARAAMEVSAEPLIPRVLTEATRRLGADPNRRNGVLATSVVGLVNGSGPFPANALVEFMGFAAVADPADPAMAKKMRWIPDWREFIRPLDLTLGYFSVLGPTLFLTRPGTAYAPGAGMTGNIDLTTVTRPAVVAGNITMGADIEQEAINLMATALRHGWEAREVKDGRKLP